MVSYEDFRKIDLKVAKILEVKDHPNADRLYVLKVDIGGSEKQIVAGIRTNYSHDELIGKKVVVIDNLEPAAIRGENSFGMLLAASGENGPVILTLERDVPTGSIVK